MQRLQDDYAQLREEFLTRMEAYSHRLATLWQTLTDEREAAVQDYRPATDIIFVVQHGEKATLLGMRATPPRLPPSEVGQRNGAPPLVPSA